MPSIVCSVGTDCSMDDKSNQWRVKCGLSQGEIDSISDCEPEIKSIYQDYCERQDEFSDIAINISSRLQRIPEVHSVRWRVKSPAHLIRKIVRKKTDKIEKYAEINVSNYRSIVSDLIGIRALHLFKEQLKKIHAEISERWDFEETVAYVRDGDNPAFKELYGSLGLAVRIHEDGYRSVHYVFETKVTKHAALVELQVRTIFEEGWSEIDHLVRYPDFGDDPLVGRFLNIFNRLSGAADEMGSFVNVLSDGIKIYREELESARSQTQSISQELSSKIVEIASLGESYSDMQAELDKLKEIDKRRTKSIEVQESLARVHKRTASETNSIRNFMRFLDESGRADSNNAKLEKALFIINPDLSMVIGDPKKTSKTETEPNINSEGKPDDNKDDGSE